MRVAYLATRLLDPDNVKSWSGLPYFIRLALENAGVDVAVVRADESGRTLRWARFLYWRWLRGSRYLRYCDASLLKHYARQYERQLADLSVDAVFSPSTWLVAYLKTKHPAVFWTDACFAGMRDFYASFSKLAPPSVRAGHLIEQRALARCARAIYCSDWAAETARRSYRVDPAKISVVPFGANLPEMPPAEEVRAAVRTRSPARCELLFVGIDWIRKGADIAVQAAEALAARGVPCRLTIAGCRPPERRTLPDYVEIVPFIDKGSRAGREKLYQLYKQSHFFILPTQAEAFGIVLSEACAFGVPCLTTRVGGLSSVVTDEVNGRLFDRDAPGREYADYIITILSDPLRYREMALHAVDEAHNRLSWAASGPKVADLLRRVLSARAEPKSATWTFRKPVVP